MVADSNPGSWPLLVCVVKVMVSERQSSLVIVLAVLMKEELVYLYPRKHLNREIIGHIGTGKKHLVSMPN